MSGVRDGEAVVLEHVEVLRASPRAILARVEIERPHVGRDPTREHRDLWIPQSIILDDSECWKAGDVGTLVVPLWFAEREGLA